MYERMRARLTLASALIAGALVASACSPGRIAEPVAPLGPDGLVADPSARPSPRPTTSPTASPTPSPAPDGGVDPFACEPAPPTPPPPPPPTAQDTLSPTRLLRRMSLTLTGRPPSQAQLEAMVATTTTAEREALLEQLVDDALASPRFYAQMVAFGHDWLRVGRYSTGAQGEAYWGHMSGSLEVCPANSATPGALYVVGDAPMSDGRDGNNNRVPDVCEGLAWDASGRPGAPPVSMEPWWAPGTTVQVVGRAGGGTRQHPRKDGRGTLTCGLYAGIYFTAGINDDAASIDDPSCSCGPNLVYCSPDGSGFAQSNTHDPTMQRRMAWEEPARLLGHIAWHDRPLSDLITGAYSVGPNKLRHLYVRHSRQNPANVAQDDDERWWKNGDAVPTDPDHDAADPYAWREFLPSALHRHLLADRDARYDPRTTREPPAGIPTAGVLTMFASQSAFARERVRAARWLEIFTCRDFAPPPASQQFSPFAVDPATTGTCQHCHALIDPAAIFFKRWDFGGHYIGPTPMIPQIGPWAIPTDYTANGMPYSRWRQSWVPGTVLTPITPAELAANPYAFFLDHLPRGQRLLGVEGDGTYGPLGFGKILLGSGQFDTCATRRVAELVLGRALDPVTEPGYIDALTTKFVNGGRRVRPFIRELLREPSVRRGL
jgi:hypothetical protein